MRQNFVAQFVQLLKRWLYNVRSDVVIEKNRALSVDQCWLHALQFLVRLIYLLSILLGCNGFTRIQKAVVGQMSSRPPVTMTFFWCKFGFGKCFGASSSSNHKLVVTGIRVFSNESPLRIRWPKYWRFTFNISPSQEYSVGSP